MQQLFLSVLCVLGYTVYALSIFLCFVFCKFIICLQTENILTHHGFGILRL